MLRLLLDEHISYAVADGLSARRSDIGIVSIHHWRNGELAGRPDHLVLLAASEAGLTLVSSDVNTIPRLLSEWGDLGRPHSGVIFVPVRLLRASSIGNLIRSLERFWDRECNEDWTDRVDFLRVE